MCGLASGSRKYYRSQGYTRAQASAQVIRHMSQGNGVDGSTTPSSGDKRKGRSDSEGDDDENNRPWKQAKEEETAQQYNNNYEMEPTEVLYESDDDAETVEQRAARFARIAGTPYVPNSETERRERAAARGTNELVDAAKLIVMAIAARGYVYNHEDMIEDMIGESLELHRSQEGHEAEARESKHYLYKTVVDILVAKAANQIMPSRYMAQYIKDNTLIPKMQEPGTYVETMKQIMKDTNIASQHAAKREIQTSEAKEREAKRETARSEGRALYEEELVSYYDTILDEFGGRIVYPTRYLAIAEEHNNHRPSIREAFALLAFMRKAKESHSVAPNNTYDPDLLEMCKYAAENALDVFVDKHRTHSPVTLVEGEYNVPAWVHPDEDTVQWQRVLPLFVAWIHDSPKTDAVEFVSNAFDDAFALYNSRTRHEYIERMSEHARNIRGDVDVEAAIAFANDDIEMTITNRLEPKEYFDRQMVQVRAWIDETGNNRTAEWHNEYIKEYEMRVDVLPQLFARELLDEFTKIMPTVVLHEAHKEVGDVAEAEAEQGEMAQPLSEEPQTSDFQHIAHANVHTCVGDFYVESSNLHTNDTWTKLQRCTKNVYVSQDENVAVGNDYNMYFPSKLSHIEGTLLLTHLQYETLGENIKVVTHVGSLIADGCTNITSLMELIQLESCDLGITVSNCNVITHLFDQSKIARLLTLTLHNNPRMTHTASWPMLINIVDIELSWCDSMQTFDILNENSAPNLTMNRNIVAENMRSLQTLVVPIGIEYMNKLWAKDCPALHTIYMGSLEEVHSLWLEDLVALQTLSGLARNFMIGRIATLQNLPLLAEIEQLETARDNALEE